LWITQQNLSIRRESLPQIALSGSPSTLFDLAVHA
jgi:hypothetical protein